MSKARVSISYPSTTPDHSDRLDKRAIEAAGDHPDDSGEGMGSRDMGWTVDSEKAEAIKRRLEHVGFDVKVTYAQ